jgi:hypothetical protein
LHEIAVRFKSLRGFVVNLTFDSKLAGTQNKSVCITGGATSTFGAKAAALLLLPQAVVIRFVFVLLSRISRERNLFCRTTQHTNCFFNFVAFYQLRALLAIELAMPSMHSRTCAQKIKHAPAHIQLNSSRML